MRQLRKKREEDKLLFEGGTGKVTSENAATKIVELSKKVRELNAELQSEKTKSKQNAKRVMELENQVGASYCTIAVVLVCPLVDGGWIFAVVFITCSSKLLSRLQLTMAH